MVSSNPNADDEWGEDRVGKLLLMDGFDDAFIGVGHRCGQPDLAIYDTEKILEILMERDGMTSEDAIEHFEFNIAGSWVGEQTPMMVFKQELPQRV
tara:strand:- start:92 stop:379 length:288 start_codon:yes stop_codon:yes gene_type:complete